MTHLVDEFRVLVRAFVYFEKFTSINIMWSDNLVCKFRQKHIDFSLGSILSTTASESTVLFTLCAEWQMITMKWNCFNTQRIAHNICPLHFQTFHPEFSGVFGTFLTINGEKQNSVIDPNYVERTQQMNIKTKLVYCLKLFDVYILYSRYMCIFDTMLRNGKKKRKILNEHTECSHTIEQFDINAERSHSIRCSSASIHKKKLAWREPHAVVFVFSIWIADWMLAGSAGEPYAKQWTRKEVDDLSVCRGKIAAKFHFIENFPLAHIVPTHCDF